MYYFQGQSYLLNVVNCLQNMVAIRGNKYIELFTAANKISVHNHQDRCKRVMGKLVQRQLHRIISGYINKRETIINLKVSDYGIKQIKTRWGSCNITQR